MKMIVALIGDHRDSYGVVPIWRALPRAADYSVVVFRVESTRTRPTAAADTHEARRAPDAGAVPGDATAET